MYISSLAIEMLTVNLVPKGVSCWVWDLISCVWTYKASWEVFNQGLCLPLRLSL